MTDSEQLWSAFVGAIVILAMLFGFSSLFGPAHDPRSRVEGWNYRDNRINEERYHGWMTKKDVTGWDDPNEWTTYKPLPIGQ